MHKITLPAYAKLPAGKFLLIEWEAARIAFGNDPTDWQWQHWLKGLHSANARDALRQRDEAALAAIES